MPGGGGGGGEGGGVLVLWQLKKWVIRKYSKIS